ncbi:MAG: hypothetical protein R6V62_10005 [Candidatus Fermentibacteraceae bacterium]
MKTLVLVMLISALAFAAGEFSTGGSELLKFRGTGSFRWDFYGKEGENPSNNMSSCAIIDWLPKLNNYVDGQFSIELYSNSGNIKLTDLFLNLHLTEDIALRGGQFKVPFGYANTLPSSTMPFGSRAMVVGTPDFNVYGGRDIGACLMAGFDMVNVDLAFTNGTGDNDTADSTISNQFTARVVADPAEWLKIGASVAMVGQPELTGGEVTVDSWSSMGLDAYAVVDYPVNESVDLHFAGEFMQLGYAGVELEGFDQIDGNAMLFTLAANFETGSEFVQAVRPAVRYETFSPMSYLEIEDNKTAIDFCVNLDLFSAANTLQLGARNYGFEDENADGYTDIYANWRMNF